MPDGCCTFHIQTWQSTELEDKHSALSSIACALLYNAFLWQYILYTVIECYYQQYLKSTWTWMVVIKADYHFLLMVDVCNTRAISISSYILEFYCCATIKLARSTYMLVVCFQLLLGPGVSFNYDQFGFSVGFQGLCQDLQCCILNKAQSIQSISVQLSLLSARTSLQYQFEFKGWLADTLF